MIGLDAPTLLFDGARILALGGGGGSGSDGTMSGNKGNEASIDAVMPAQGGFPPSGTNGGGNGCQLSGNSAGNGGNVQSGSTGGGGGGGGGGYILEFGTREPGGASSNIHPPPGP
jgi:hypothetical protein